MVPPVLAYGTHPAIAFPLYLAMGLAWLACIVVPLRALARGWRADGRRTGALAALFAAGGALRLARATWGPHNDDLRYAELFNESFAAVDWHLGTAPIVFMRFAMLVLPRLDTTIVGFSLLWGALAPPLLVLALVELGARRTLAFTSGLLLAVHPVAVHFSGGMTRVAPVLFLTAVALWSLGRYHRRGDPWHLASFVGAVWLGAQTRPEAGLVLVPAGLAVVLLLAPSVRALFSPPHREELLAALLAGTISTGHLLVSAQVVPMIGQHLDSVVSWRFPFTPDRTPLLSLSYTPAAMMALALAGALAAMVRRERFALWALASLVLVVALEPPGTTVNLWFARYHGIPVLLFCVLAAVGTQALMDLAPRSRAGVAAVVALGVAATSVAPLRWVGEPRTVDLEYRFLRESLPTLPRCAVIYRPFDPARDFTGAFRHGHLVSVMLRHGRWRNWPPGSPAGFDPSEAVNAPPKGRECPTYFFLSPACHVDRRFLEETYASGYIVDHCREAMARAGGRPVVTAEIAAAPLGGETFTRTRLPIGFYLFEDAPVASQPR